MESLCSNEVPDYLSEESMLRGLYGDGDPGSFPGEREGWGEERSHDFNTTL